MDVRSELTSLGNLVPIERLEVAMRWIQGFSEEPIDAVIPSIRLGADGPFVSSIFLLTATYMIEIRLGQPDIDFDFIALKSVYDYRVVIGEHIVKLDDDRDLTYQKAVITLTHDRAASQSE